MKRIAALLSLALGCCAIAWSVYQTDAPAAAARPLAQFVPAGSMLYVESKDCASLLREWNSSAAKEHWVASDSYAVFSQSRLFLRLEGAGEEFSKAAGLPPDMKFLTQAAGDRSALALYDIGKLQFLYITHLPQAQAMQSTLWQSRAKFEPRTVGGATFYVRQEPKSQRVVAFAVMGDYLLLATREDLLAGALQLMSGSKGLTIESEAYYAKAAAQTQEVGDLRMVLNLEKIVPDGYFRTYWVQQNITDLSHYSAAVSDLYLSADNYREERTLIRKAELEQPVAPESLAAAAEVVRLVPEDAGTYQALANPSPKSCFELLRVKLLAPHASVFSPSDNAPQVRLTSGETGSGSDLETRIDEVTTVRSSKLEKSALEKLLERTEFRASLQMQSTERDQAGVFIRTHTGVVLVAAGDWGAAAVKPAITGYLHPGTTASELGLAWRQQSGYEELDGLWPLLIAARGNTLMLSDDEATMQAMLANFERKPSFAPGDYFAGFNHHRERPNFLRLVDVVDRPSTMASAQSDAREPQFFSGTVGSLSQTLSGVASESVVTRGDKDKLHQTVIYEWSH
jgi:hypothetical protein